MERAAYVDRRGPVGWVVIGDVEAGMERGWEVEEYVEIHSAIAAALHELRFDPDIRIVGLTGSADGAFYSLPRRQRYDDEQRHRDRHHRAKRVEPGLHPRGLPHGVPNAIETLALLTKPVIARVNGDAIGFGQSLLWGCDIIVALSSAVISDVHMGQGDVIDHRGERRGFPYGIAPGDGAMAFWPLFLSPTKAKEYQLLSRAWTARELADMNIVNYAMDDMEAVDEQVRSLIGELLARPQHALAHTKRLHQKALIAQWNLAQDLAAAYEHLDLIQHADEGHMDPLWSAPAVGIPDGGWIPPTA